jgi:hypothetical protein
MAYTPTTQVIKNNDGSYTVTTPTGSSTVAGNKVATTSGAGAYGTPTTTTTTPPVAPPSDISKINQVGEITLPEIPPKIGDISTATASTAGSKTRVDNLEKQFQEMTAANVGATRSSLLNLLQKDRTQTREDIYKELGISSKDYLSDRKVLISEIDSLSQDYAKKEAEMERRIMEFEKNSTGMLQGALDQRANEIRQSYAIELNAKSAYIKSKSAILQALDGNFQLARDLANDAVNDVVADQKLKMDATLQFYDMYQDVINTMELPYKRAIEEAALREERAYNQSVKDAEFVRDLMLDNVNAKINITDSPQEAYRKYTAAGGGSITGGSEGVTTSTSMFDDVMQAAIDAGASTSLAALKAVEYAESKGIQLSQAERNSLVERAKNLTKTVAPITPTQTSAKTPVTPYQAGQNVGTGIKPYLEAMEPQNLWGGVKTVGGTVGNFFSGLFGL